jgi:hypothetical protein
MQKLPLINTSVSCEKSISEIIGYLSKMDFDKIAQASDREKGWTIMASKDGITFCWSVNYLKIMQLLIDKTNENNKYQLRHNTNYGLQLKSKFKSQSEMIAWRVLAHKIKADCDAVLYESASIADVFAGYLVMNTSNGMTTVGKHIAQSASEGRLNIPDIMGPLLLTSNNE